MVIYLGAPLPVRSSHLLRTAGPALRSPTVLLRIEFTAATCLHALGELLPRLSTLTGLPGSSPAVYLCCTCPRVAPGGCYPLSLPCGARTFLTHSLSACARGCSACSPDYFTHPARDSQAEENIFSEREDIFCLLFPIYAVHVSWTA